MRTTIINIVVMMQVYGMVVHCSGFDPDSSASTNATVAAQVDFDSQNHVTQRDQEIEKPWSIQKNLSENDLPNLKVVKKSFRQVFGPEIIWQLHKSLVVVDPVRFGRRRDDVRFNRSDVSFVSRDDLLLDRIRLPHDVVGLFGKVFNEADEPVWIRIDPTRFESDPFLSQIEQFYIVRNEKNRALVERFYRF